MRKLLVSLLILVSLCGAQTLTVVPEITSPTHAEVVELPFTATWDVYADAVEMEAIFWHGETTVEIEESVVGGSRTFVAAEFALAGFLDYDEFYGRIRLRLRGGPWSDFVCFIVVVPDTMGPVETSWGGIKCLVN